MGFLLCLNVFLLLVGCFLDIYSATFVVVPLILPLGEAYGIHPIHMGIIFVANLELGYLTPPIGLNLFLSSYRFDRSLFAIYRAALPFLLLLGAGVLAITYLPFLEHRLPGGVTQAMRPLRSLTTKSATWVAHQEFGLTRTWKP